MFNTTLKTSIITQINILSYKKDKNGENSVKCGEIIIFDHKFYLKTANFPSNFVPAVGICKKFFPGWGF